jgi:hypothetical protein
MRHSSDRFEVFLELGQKRVFAGALDWPGWCRSGRDETLALQALFEYGPRYAQVLRTARLGFRAPKNMSAFAVVERLKGNTTTDFGAPDVAPSGDTDPIDDAELRRFQTLLRACWRAFDAVIQKARGQTLQKGPRGGGRDLDKIMEHVLGSDEGYLSSLGWKLDLFEEKDPIEALKHTRQMILKGLVAAANNEIPRRGPRGGVRWTPRYFVRRVAWHTLDHVWEIEDRLQGKPG